MIATHIYYLKAMGIDSWVRRDLITQETPITEPVHIPPPPQPVVTTPIIEPVRIPIPQPPLPVVETPIIEPVHIPQPPQPVVITPSWESLQHQVVTCTACELHKTRRQTVLGVGNQNADLMLIGEAPGADEDVQGEPFVGRSGKLLNAMLYAIDLKRESIYIANVLKCRPPGNRNPQLPELVCCQTFLDIQIQLIKPKLIVAVGGIAAHHLLATNTGIGKLRGQLLAYKNIPLIATYHPSFLLRRPSEKRHAWLDLQLIRHTLNEIS